MSAEILRRAAALMRERAEEPVAQPDRWPQVVAPAVADLLDAEAERWLKEQDRTWGCVLIRTDFEPPTETSARNALQAECDAAADRLCAPALAVARAYLRGAA